MTTRKKVSSILLVTTLLLSVVFITSFDSSEKKTRKNCVPFILHLSQNETDKVTSILDSTKSVQMRSGFVTLQPGENVGSHNTGQHEELLVILDGSGYADVEDLGKTNIEKGMVVYIPPNNQHNVYCDGSSPLKYIYIVAPTK
ncbi:MAG TPA: cupin domain-containing protein [Candidatus Acidoferrales bacterium]|nr:cupin domain-containing protein [Candidatus Acidoferrales bacterium]